MSTTKAPPVLTRAAIAGNPNSGKTSLFNEMTGSRRAVGNYPGVTVEREEGYIRCDGRELCMVDLPGTYSLTAYSAEEVVVRNFVIDEKPEVVVDVVDATNLERNLYLAVQLMEMEVPLVIALNMIDVAEKRRLTIDSEKMATLLGVPVIPTVGRTGRGKEEVLQACVAVAEGASGYERRAVTYGHEVDDQIEALAEVVARDEGLSERFAPRWLAVRLIEKDEHAAAAVKSTADDPTVIEKAAAAAIRSIEAHFGESAGTIVAEARHGFAAGVVRECVRQTAETRRNTTAKVDAIVCHRVVGPLILAGVVYALFVAVFKVTDEWEWMAGKSPTGWMEWGFASAASAIAGLKTSSPMLHSFLADGIIGGVGGIMSFVPLIFVMFLFVAILEDTGYIARVAFVLDRVLKAFGLQGKSVIAMIVSGGLGGGGCAVPGVMATRTLRDPRDRLVTMLVAPFMNCGAKIPVYLMLIAAFFPGSQAKMMFLLWGLSWTVALGVAWVLRRLVIRGEPAPFVMELPSYHIPTVRGVLRHAWMRTWGYIRKAGTTILAISLVIWVIMYFPRMDDRAYQARLEAAAERNAPADVIAEIENERSEAQLRHSVAGRIGSTLEPASSLAGFDWRDNIALVGGFAAKEVIIGTLGVAYSMGDVDPHAPASLSSRLAGDPGWTPLGAFSLLMFVMIYAPCITTLAMIRKESGTWRWPIFSTVASTSLAFIVAVAVYRVGGALGLGV